MDASQTYALRNLGHAHLVLGNADQAERWYLAAIEQRHEGEDFQDTIGVIRKLLAERPDTARATEFLAIFEQEQAAIEIARRERDDRALRLADSGTETVTSMMRH
jgi:uncharacterized protein (UPF0128 family)